MLMACSNDEKEYDATGTFEVTEVTVSAKASGELIIFEIQEGQELAASAIVGHIDDTQLKLKKEQLESTKAQLNANRRQLGANRNATSSKQLDLEKQVASIRQQIANARREKQRYTELLRDGAVPKKQVDDISYQISVLENNWPPHKTKSEATTPAWHSRVQASTHKSRASMPRVQASMPNRHNLTTKLPTLPSKVPSLEASLKSMWNRVNLSPWGNHYSRWPTPEK